MLNSSVILRGSFLSGKRLNIQQLQPDRTLSIFIEENCKPVLGRLTDWFRYMFESDVQVALLVAERVKASFLGCLSPDFVDHRDTIQKSKSRNHLPLDTEVRAVEEEEQTRRG